MRLKQYCLPLLSAVAMAGCSSVPVFPTPPVAVASLEVGSEALDVAAYLPPSKRVEGTDFYIVQFEGGSLVLAILAGPIGSAISGSMIDAKTGDTAKAFNAEARLDLARKLKDSLSSYSYYNSGGDKANAYVLSSALLLQLSKDKKMRTSLIIRASNGKTGGPSWSEHYFYHFEYMPDVKLFEEKRFAEYVSNASKELDQAVNTLVKVVVTDLAKQSQDSPPVRVKSNFFGQFEMVPYPAAEIANHPGSSVFRIDGKPGVVPMPFAQGIHVFRPTQFEKLPY
jgi:hypothetical protein